MTSGASSYGSDWYEYRRNWTRHIPEHVIIFSLDAAPIEVHQSRRGFTRELDSLTHIEGGLFLCVQRRQSLAVVVLSLWSETMNSWSPYPIQGRCRFARLWAERRGLLGERHVNQLARLSAALGWL